MKLPVLFNFARQFFILWMVTRGTTSVVLKEVKVPTMVQNGTLTHVILDCVYGLNHSEKDGMILKWYFNGKNIFQWIPPSKPKGVGMMKGRINLDYERSPDPYDRHRALYLYLPTTEMTGDYTCKVSTLQNDVTATKRMTVFVPPRVVQINHYKGHDIVQSVNVSCVADYVYPQPTVEIYHGHGTNRMLLKGVIERAVQYPDGAWQKIAFVVLADKSLQEANVFECVVRIPDTPYRVTRTIIYTPTHPTVMASASNSSPARSLCWLTALLWFISFILESNLVKSR